MTKQITTSYIKKKIIKKIHKIKMKSLILVYFTLIGLINCDGWFQKCPKVELAPNFNWKLVK